MPALRRKGYKLNRRKPGRKQIIVYVLICLLLTIGLAVGNQWFQRHPAEKSSAVTVYFVRHGQTESNVQGLLVGAGANYDLTETGIKQVTERGEKLSDIRFDKAYSSTLGRAVDTRNIILEENIYAGDTPTEALSGLNDISWGDAEGMTMAEAAEAFEGFSFETAFGSIDDSDYESPIHAESLYDFVHRFDDTMSKIVDTSDRKETTILVVAHNSMQFWMNWVLKEEAVDEIENAEAVIMVYENGTWKLVEEEK